MRLVVIPNDVVHPGLLEPKPQQQGKMGGGETQVHLTSQ